MNHYIKQSADYSNQVTQQSPSIYLFINVPIFLLWSSSGTMTCLPPPLREHPGSCEALSFPAALCHVSWFLCQGGQARDDSSRGL